jgi:hypothetical protein
MIFMHTLLNKLVMNKVYKNSATTGSMKIVLVVPLARMDKLSSTVEEAFQSLVVPFPNLKTQQKDAVMAFLQGKDVFVGLPTGFGKTIIPALLPACLDNRSTLQMASLTKSSSTPQIHSDSLMLELLQPLSFSPITPTQPYTQEPEDIDGGLWSQHHPRCDPAMWQNASAAYGSGQEVPPAIIRGALQGQRRAGHERRHQLPVGQWGFQR